MSIGINRIDYEARRRDLSEKYSYAISRLGTVALEKRQFWRDMLEDVNLRVQELEVEYRKHR